MAQIHSNHLRKQNKTKIPPGHKRSQYFPSLLVGKWGSYVPPNWIWKIEEVEFRQLVIVKISHYSLVVLDLELNELF